MLAASNPHATRDGVGAILAAATTTAVKTDGSLAVFTFRVKAAGDAKLTLPMRSFLTLTARRSRFPIRSRR